METKDLINYYNKYKSKLLPAFFILAGIVLFTQVTLPNFSTIATLTKEVNSAQKKIQSLKDSIALLSSLNQKVLDHQVSLVTSALPPSKDISSVYSALSLTSATSGVVQTGFSVSVGNIFKKNGGINTAPGVPGTPALLVKADLSNLSKENLASYTKALVYAFPLNQISSIQISGGTGVLGISFFYKPYDLDLINRNDITQLTSSEIKTLDSLEEDLAKQ